MPDLSDITKLGLTGWPLAITAIVAIIGVVILWQGWPWDGIEGIIVHKHYHNGVEEPEEEEEEEE